MATDALIAESMRQALPSLAGEIRPGEMVATWIERAARVTGIPAARLRAYWHRKVEAPRASEYIAVIDALNAAEARRRAIEQLEQEIATRAAQLQGHREALSAASPLLARLAPPDLAAPEAAPEAAPAQAGVAPAPRRGGGR